MLSTQAIKILEEAIEKAIEAEAKNVQIPPEMEGLLTAEECASATVMEYLRRK